MEESGKFSGFSIDLFDLWAEKNQFELNYYFEDYKKLIELYENKKIDVIANYFQTETGESHPEKLFEFKEMNFFPITVFKFPSDNISLGKLKSCSSIGILPGFKYEDLFEDLNYSEFPSFSDLTESLINGKVDAIIVPYIYYEYISGKGFPVIKGAGYFDNYEYGILFEDTNLKANFSEFIEQNNDQYNNLQNKWLGETYFPQSLTSRELKFLLLLFFLILIILIIFIIIIRIITAKNLNNLKKEINRNTEFNIKASNLLNTALSKEVSEKSFFMKMLDFITDVNKEINKCSISIYKGNKIKFIAQKGYSDILYEQNIEKDSFIIPDKQIEIKNLSEKNIENNYEWAKNLYRNGFIEIKNSLITPYKYKDGIIGNLTLDKYENKSFSFATKQNALFLANLSSIYLYLKDQTEKIEKFNVEIRNILLKAIELNSNFTQNHSLNVSIISRKIGEIMGLDSTDINNSELAGMLHDIGKIGISQNIINKPGKLTYEEYDVVKAHVEKGVNILSESYIFKDIVNIVANHHERWDGDGYPYKSKGESIPLLSRILCVADSIEAMLNDRPYRKGMTKDDVLKELREQSGEQFDPNIIDIVTENFDEIVEVIGK
jgi:putative nucleotidyltransferase with HDIG domain